MPVFFKILACRPFKSDIGFISELLDLFKIDARFFNFVRKDQSRNPSALKKSDWTKNRETPRCNAIFIYAKGL